MAELKRICNGNFINHYRVIKDTNVYKYVEDFYDRRNKYIMELTLPKGSIIFSEELDYVGKEEVDPKVFFRKSNMEKSAKCRSNMLIPRKLWIVARKYKNDIILNEGKFTSLVVASYMGDFIYSKDALKKPDSYSSSRNCCTGGLHFFFHIQDALKWGGIKT